jgi:hypothetical protein
MYRKSKIHLQGETRKLTSLRPEEPTEAESTARVGRREKEAMEGVVAGGRSGNRYHP